MSFECVSPLMFYSSTSNKYCNKHYAWGNTFFFACEPGTIPGFQICISDDIDIRGLSLVGKNTGTISLSTPQLVLEDKESKLRVIEFQESQHQLQKDVYYYALYTSNGTYVSEDFSHVDDITKYVCIEYAPKNTLYAKNLIISPSSGFRFKVLLNTSLARPEYKYDEESTKRHGYEFIESVISRKVLKCSAVVPEYICDALRVVKLCENTKLTDKATGKSYEVMHSDFIADWQTQGDLAIVTLSFVVDNNILNLGGYHE